MTSLAFDFSRPAPQLRKPDPVSVVPAAAPAFVSWEAMGLRSYQGKALDGWLATVETARGGVVVMATGTGKTLTAGALMKRWPELSRRWSLSPRCLWLTHMDTLVSQARDDLEKCIGEYIDIDQGKNAFAGKNAGVVIASLMTISRPARLNRFARDHFGLIVVDEAHHAAAATYRRVLDYFSSAKLMAITATPNRMDKASLDDVVGPRAFTYGILHGIDDGYLVPIRTAVAELSKLDLSKLKARGGDFSDHDLAGAMDNPEVFAAIVSGTLEHAKDRRTVAFFPSVEVAHVAAEAFNKAKPDCARAVDGGSYTDTDEKRRILRDHQEGRFQVLCNVGVAAEGYNDKGIGCVAIVRPTKSKSAHAQWVGRGTRPLADVDSDRPSREARRARIASSSKPDLLVIDFTANSGKHDLASVVDYMAGGADEETVKRAKKIAKKTPGIRVDEALAKAGKEMEAVRAKRKAEAERIAKANAVTLTWKTVDPFKAMGTSIPQAKPGEVRASRAQRELLERFRIECPPGLSFSQAQHLIRTFKARQKAGLATPGQVAKLRDKRVPAPERLSYITASRVLDALSANLWRPLQPDVLASIVGSNEPGSNG